MDRPGWYWIGLHRPGSAGISLDHPLITLALGPQAADIQAAQRKQRNAGFQDILQCRINQPYPVFQGVNCSLPAAS